MAFNVSGTVYTDQGVTAMGAGRTVAVSVNGGAVSITTTTAADGTFALTGLVGTFPPICIFLQGNTEKGATLIVPNGINTNVTGAKIYQDCLLLHKPTNAGSLVTGTHINTCNNSGDADIAELYSSSSNTAYTVASGKILVLENSQTGGGSGVTATLGGSFVCLVDISLATALVFTGTGTINYAPGGAGALNAPLTINSGGTVTLAADLRMIAGGSAVLNLQSGAFDVSASNYNITVGGNASSTTFWNNTGGTFTPRQGAVTFGTASGSSSGKIKSNGQAFYNVIIAGTTWTLSDAIDINGGLTINSSKTLASGGFAVNVAGNWANSGTYTASSNTVTLDGTAQTVSGSSTFYNLVANNSGDVITFTDGTTQTVTNSVTFQNVTLQGSGTGGWTIAMPATQTIDHVTVSYSTATGNAAVANDGTSTNGGNNVNWTFPGAGGAPVNLAVNAKHRRRR